MKPAYRQVVEDLTGTYTESVIAPHFHLPIRENEKFVGYVNVITECRQDAGQA